MLLKRKYINLNSYRPKLKQCSYCLYVSKLWFILLLLITSCVPNRDKKTLNEVFEPLLVIGNTENTNVEYNCPIIDGLLGWPEVRTDINNNIYVLDKMFYTINKYKSNGSHEYQIKLKKGQGPAEVIDAISFAVDDFGQVYLLDNAKLKVNKYVNGKYSTSYQINKMASMVKYMDNNKLVLLNIGPLNSTDEQTNTLFQVLNLEDGKIVDVGTPVSTLEQWGGYSFFLQNDDIWVASGGGYEIVHYSKFKFIDKFKGDRDCIPPQVFKRGETVSIAWPSTAGIGSIFTIKEYLFVRTFGTVGNNLDVFNLKTKKLVSTFEDFEGLFDAIDKDGYVYITYDTYIVKAKVHF